MSGKFPRAVSPQCSSVVVECTDINTVLSEKAFTETRWKASIENIRTDKRDSRYDNLDNVIAMNLKCQRYEQLDVQKYQSECLNQLCKKSNNPPQENELLIPTTVQDFEESDSEEVRDEGAVADISDMITTSSLKEEETVVINRAESKLPPIDNDVTSDLGTEEITEEVDCYKRPHKGNDSAIGNSLSTSNNEGQSYVWTGSL